MTTRMSTAKLLAMGDRRVGDENETLLTRARMMVNSSPEPRHAIHKWDLLLAMKEKERLGINFNRSVTMSLESRWEVVNKLTVEFLQEVVSLNDQLSDESNKQARQLITLILARTQRLSIASRIEQMAGLLMHITFYRTVLKAKLGELQESTDFLVHCSELLGFQHPLQIMDRYSALRFTLNEISEDHEKRVADLGKLHDRKQEMLEQALEESIVLYNTMATLHGRLKEVRIEISEMERFVDEKERQAAESEVELKSIKESIHHCYTSIMTYKGMECSHTCPLRQMDELGIRLTITLSAVKFVEDQLSREATMATSRVSKSSRGSATGEAEELGDQDEAGVGEGGKRDSMRSMTVKGSDQHVGRKSIDGPGSRQFASANRSMNRAEVNQEKINVSMNRLTQPSEENKQKGSSTKEHKESCMHGANINTSLRQSYQPIKRSMKREEEYQHNTKKSIAHQNLQEQNINDGHSGKITRAGRVVQKRNSQALEKTDHVSSILSAASSVGPCKDVNRTGGNRSHIERYLGKQLCVKNQLAKSPLSPVVTSGSARALCERVHPSQSFCMGETGSVVGTKRSCVSTLRGESSLVSDKSNSISHADATLLSQSVCKAHRQNDFISSVAQNSKSGMLLPMVSVASSCASLDRSQNKFNRSGRTRENTARPCSSHRDRFPKVTESRTSSVQRVTPCSERQESMTIGKFTSESCSNVRHHLMRMSDRIRNQVQKPDRLYYLSDASAQFEQTLEEGEWDDGVCLMPLEQPKNNTERSRRARSRTRLNKREGVKKCNQSNRDSTVNDNLTKEPSEIRSSEKVRCNQRNGIPETLKAAVKRLSSSTNSTLRKDVDFFRRTAKGQTVKGKVTRDKTEMSPLNRRQSTGSLRRSLQLEPLKTHLSEGHIKKRREAPLDNKAVNCDRIHQHPHTLRFRSHEPPLRRASLFQEKWRRCGRAIEDIQSPNGTRTIHTVSQSASGAGGANVLRNLCKTRHLKRDCLAILASVKLGSRWPEDQLPTE